MITRKFLLIIISLACSLTVTAQGETRIGIKGGFTSSNVNGPDVSQLSNNGNPTALGGIHFGIFINSKIHKNFWIKSELLTIQKGATLQIANSSGSSQSKFKSQYIDVYPVSPTVHWKGFQLLAGPYVSMLLSSSIQDSVVFGHASALSSYRQKLDAGFVLGVEYELTKIGISIGLRYTKGYVPLFENAAVIVTSPTAPPQPVQKIYNESLSFSIGYSFGSKSNALKK